MFFIFQGEEKKNEGGEKKMADDEGRKNKIKEKRDAMAGGPEIGQSERSFHRLQTF